MSDTRLYRIWAAMKTRCSNSKQPSYKDYGGRGIKVCDEWWNSFVCFMEWATENGYTEELTLDRIDVDGGYSPKNCKWSTRHEQAMNRRNTIYETLTAFGETKTLREWSEDKRCVVGSTTLAYRNGAGWEPERAITQASERRGDARGRYSLQLSRYLEKNHPEILDEFLAQ